MSMIPESSELAGLMRGPSVEPCDDDAAAAGGCKAIVAIALRRPNAVAKWLQVSKAPTHLSRTQPWMGTLRLRSDGYVLERAPEPRMRMRTARDGRTNGGWRAVLWGP